MGDARGSDVGGVQVARGKKGGRVQGGVEVRAGERACYEEAGAGGGCWKVMMVGWEGDREVEGRKHLYLVASAVASPAWSLTSTYLAARQE